MTSTHTRGNPFAQQLVLVGTAFGMCTLHVYLRGDLFRQTDTIARQPVRTKSTHSRGNPFAQIHDFVKSTHSRGNAFAQQPVLIGTAFVCVIFVCIRSATIFARSTQARGIPFAQQECMTT